MDSLRYDELCAEQAEARLAAIEAAKEYMHKAFMATYPNLRIEPDGIYNLQFTWDCIEEALDDYTSAERAVAEKTVASYEQKSRLNHERLESIA